MLTTGLLARIRRSLQRSETTGPVLIATTVGLLAGLGAIVLRRLIDAVRALFFGSAGSLVASPAEFLPGNLHYLLAPVVGMVTVAWMVARWAPEAKGHGVPEVQYAVRRRGGRIRQRVAAIKALVSAISIGSGGSLGREGPIVQIGSSLGSSLGQWIGLGSEQLRIMVAAGAAGAIGATFNAPIAGVMFAMEVILANFASKSFGLVVISSVTATVLAQAVLGTEPAFRLVERFTLVSEWELLLYAALGLVAGLTALFFTKTLYAVEDAFDRWEGHYLIRAAAGGLAVGALGFFGSDLIFGIGHEGTEMALQGQLTVGLMLALVLMKILATSVTLGAGGSGGVFAPSLFIGAMLGGAFGQIADAALPTVTAPAGAYALVGMAAVFGGAAHAPLTAIVILFEMTDDYQIILPLMLAVVIAYLVAVRLNPDSIYSIKLRRMGGFSPSARDVGVLDLILVDDAMSTGVATVRPDLPLRDLLHEAATQGARSWPVMDEEDRLIGIVTVTDIESALLGSETERRLVSDVMTTSVRTATPEQSLRQAFEYFAELDVQQVPVVSREDPGELLGVLPRREILWALKELSDEHERLMERTGWSMPEGSESVLIDVAVTSDAVGLAFHAVRALGIPEWALTVKIRRADRILVPRGSTIVEPGDVIAFLTTRERSDDLRLWIEQKTRPRRPESS
jgi:chloride channel protein, CIC family